MTKLEQIEKLREKANVSYDEAKSALETADGDLLDAIIYLEKQGKVKAPAGEGYYSSSGADGSGSENGYEKADQKITGESFSETIEKIGKFCVSVINKGNAASFEVLKDHESLAKFPLTVVALLLIFLPYVTIPLILIGMVFNYRYRFNGINSHDAS